MQILVVSISGIMKQSTFFVLTSCLGLIRFVPVYSHCVISNTETVENRCNTSLLPDTDVCGLSTEATLANGEEAAIDDFPWMGILKYYDKDDNKETFECGAVLISKRYAITAAHCVKLPSYKELLAVRLGEHNIGKKEDCIVNRQGKKIRCADPPVDVSIEEIVIHESYNKIRKQNDIALIRLSKDVNFTDYIQPICLPISPELLNKSFEAQVHVVAGWGLTEKYVRSEVKMKVQLLIKSNIECARAYGKRASITSGHLCAGGETNQDTCKGDSGGPLMKILELDEPFSINWYCTGIVSFGPITCGAPGMPGVYVRTTEYVEWILDNMKP